VLSVSSPVISTESSLRSKIRALGERVFSEPFVRLEGVPGVLRHLAIEAFLHGWDDDPDRAHDCAVIRQGLQWLDSHGELVDATIPGIE